MSDRAQAQINTRAIEIASATEARQSAHEDLSNRREELAATSRAELKLDMQRGFDKVEGMIAALADKVHARISDEKDARHRLVITIGGAFIALLLAVSGFLFLKLMSWARAMIDPAELRGHVIRPTLEHIGLYSPAAANLLLATVLAESVVAGRQHLVQQGGPALGIYQIEPATHRDVWDNFLSYRPDLGDLVRELVSGKKSDEARPGPLELIWNLAYATAIARLVYYRRRPPLPPADDLPGLGAYWKRFYNTAAGKGTIEGFLQKVEPFSELFTGGADV